MANRDSYEPVGREKQTDIGRYEVWRKSSLADIISVVDDFFDQWDPHTTTPMGEVYALYYVIE